jgi:hypothetical protein
MTFIFIYRLICHYLLYGLAHSIILGTLHIRFVSSVVRGCSFMYDVRRFE